MIFGLVIYIILDLSRNVMTEEAASCCSLWAWLRRRVRQTVIHMSSVEQQKQGTVEQSLRWLRLTVVRL